MRKLRRRRAGTRLIAGVVVVGLLLGVGIVAIGALSGGERAKGLAPAFDRISDEYRLRTEEFIQGTEQLNESDLATTLRHFGLILDAGDKAKKAYAGLKVPSEMEAARGRLVSALESQAASLRSAIQAARLRDERSVTQATERFGRATLNYEAARLQMQRLIDRCGARCA